MTVTRREDGKDKRREKKLELKQCSTNIFLMKLRTDLVEMAEVENTLKNFKDAAYCEHQKSN